MSTRRSTLTISTSDVPMDVPPGSVPGSRSPQEISLTDITDFSDIDIQDDESFAWYGFRLGPPNLTFTKPVIVTMPLLEIIMNPDQIRPEILYCSSESRNERSFRKASSSSPGKPPYCRIFEKHLEVYIDQSGEWCVLIPLEKQMVQSQLLCTPYIPDRIEHGKQFMIHLRVHKDSSGYESSVHEEERYQAYHKAHRLVPFRIKAKSGDITVNLKDEDSTVKSKIITFKDLHRRWDHNVFLSMTPSADRDFEEVNITITQGGMFSRSLTFVIRCSDAPLCHSLSDPKSSFIRAKAEVSSSDLPDIDVLTIAQTVTENQFYDLGVALGFSIQELDIIEYGRDRQQVIYDMLFTWRNKHGSGQKAKETLLAILKSLDSPTDDISDISKSSAITEKTLLALSKKIAFEKYFEIGRELGFHKTELQHIQHQTLHDRNETNIQMLSTWKASQRSDSKAIETLKRVWESVQAASKPMENVTDDADIHWEFITHTPPELKLQDDETVISCGIRFFPSGARFTKPVKVTLDHNVQFINPRRAEIVFYTRHKDTDIKSFVRTPASTKGYPSCDIRTKDLDLYVDHFCDWWIVAKVKELLGKTFNCTPYLEGLQPVCKGLTNTFRLYISDDLNDVNKTFSGTVGLRHKELAPSKPLFLRWRSGDVVISLMEYQEEQKVEVKVDDGNKRIQEQKLFRLSPDYETFWVKSSDTEAQQQFFKFILYQASTPKEETTIEFILNYETTVLSSASGMSAEAGPSHLPLPSSSSRCIEMVTELMLLNLAKDFPHKNYIELCLALGGSTNRAKSRLAELKYDYVDAVLEALIAWKNKKERSKNELIEVLKEIGAGGLVLKP